MHPVAVKESDNIIVVQEKNAKDGDGSPRYTYQLAGKEKIQDMHISRTPFYGVDLVIVALGNDRIMVIADTSFNPKAGAKVAPVSIAISNDADALDIACDGKTGVVVGANSATPVSLVDFDAQKEIATAPYPGKLARAVAVDDDGRNALVVLDNAMIDNASAIRRLTIAAGSLADTGEQLLFGADYVSKVRVAPGAKVGVAIVGVGASRLVAFGIPGLATKGSVALAGGTGNAVVFSPAGDRVYVRSGRRAVSPDVIEGFAFDATTGAIGQTPLLRIANVSGFTGVVFNSSMAISEDGGTLVVAEENATGQLPSPRIAQYSTATGALSGVASFLVGSTLQVLAATRACPASSAAMTAVEYHHAAFDHYFVTSIADEIAKLDNGTFAGWARTGDRFGVHAAGTAGTVPTCRFFSTAFGPKSSHFYAPTAAECATVKANADWQFEGEVFNVAPTTDGTCLPPSVPLYRLYNNGQGGAPNHRYTTRVDVRATMIANGWIPEGLGVGVVACVPPAP